MPIDKTLGYEYINDPRHPLANKSGKVYAHRIIASKKLGRLIKGNEIVHHVDGNRANNLPENLEIMSRTEHGSFHSPTKKIECKICGSLTTNKKYCSIKCMSIANRKVERPNRETLQADISELSWTAIGHKYGVTDNAVRKWAKAYSLL